MNVKIESTVRCAGFYKISVVRKDGSVRATGIANEFPNLITDNGLDAIGGKYGSGFLQYCSVGSGNTAPSVSDGSLELPVASVNYDTDSVQQSRLTGTESASPYYTFYSRTYRFPEGAAAGNLSEVGVGWSSGGTGLFSRALILDEFSNPTTITVLSDELLDVTYELRYYPKLTDDTGTVVFTGNIGGTYNWIFRTANAGVYAAEAAEDGWGMYRGNKPPAGIDTYHQTIHNGLIDTSSVITAFDGDIGLVTSTPSGGKSSRTAFTIDDYSISPYIDGSLEREYSITAGLSDFNLAAGIRSILLERWCIGSYQIQFDPAIPKTNQDKLTINFKLSWARA